MEKIATCFSMVSGLAIKCVVNGDYERKNNPKQTKSSVMECPNGVTHCITVSGKIAEGDQNY